uniref:Peptidase M16C associated domain-containing protein n=1 Tax=Haptolina brevifila TaxID=156173 RepID=A0A7S2CTU1_9EUKA
MQRSARNAFRPLMSSSATVVEACPAVVSREPATHPAFELIKVEMVDEYTIKCATYRHKKSGAELISAQADDDNKVFGIVFRTPVSDSTGVPHILEHSVLCGSDKYRSKEPFVELLKGSLQTFLNAFTYPDRTCYPVASQNTKDFYNLVNVYLDAVLHPRAKRDPTVLAQEGWHYELEDPEAPLTYKGVVFNEMKGVYSSPDSLMYRASQQLTFPDNTYSVDSGGDPNAITSLTFEQFKSFHDAYYHPANSRIFFYGDDDPAVRLELLDSYLSDFDASDATPSSSEVATQKLIRSPRRDIVKYPIEPGAEPTHMVMLSWLMHEENLSADEELSLAVLNHLLMGTPTATLYKPMMESGLGAAVMGGGVADELKQATFSIGLKGVKKEDVAKVEELAIETLRAAAKSGFDEDAIEASLNTIEFSLREFNTGGFPKGLSMMLAVMPRWLYGRGSPTDALRFEAPLANLKSRLSAGEDVFGVLLDRLIVSNEHRVTVELVPDETLAQAQKAEEEAELAAAKAQMNEAQIAEIIEATKALKTAQLAEDSPEDLATIPRVGIADLERTVQTYPTELSDLPGGGKQLTHPLPSAGVVYADILLDMSSVPLEDLPLVRFLSELLDEVGTSEMSAVAMQRRIGARTGGISTAMIFEQPTGVGGTVADPLDSVAYLAIRGKATKEKAQDLFDLSHALLADANLAGGQAKAIEMLRETQSNLESAFISSGNSFAGARLAARNSLVGYIGELTQGVTYYGHVKSMLAMAKDDWPSLLAGLERVRSTLLTQKGMIINLTTDPDALEAVQPTVDAFVSRLPAEAAVRSDAPAWRDAVQLLPRVDEAYAITTQVHYVAAGAKLYEQGESMDGAMYAVSRFLSRGYLWDNVRVVGGAYGGGCSLNTNTGAISFSSYRDPNVQGTLDIYAKAAEVLAEGELTDEALEQAIVGAVGDLDSPMNAQQKGARALTHYLTGITTETRQKFRDDVIGTKRESFRLFAERLRAAQLKVCVFGSKEALEAANAARSAEEQIEVTQLS